jgi:PAS domain S-box-containing protein
MAESTNTHRVFTKGLLLGIGIAVVLLLFNAGLAYWNANRISEDTLAVSHTNEVLDAMDELFSTMKDAETGERGYLITGDAQYLEPYNAAVAAIQQNIERVKRLTADDPRQQSRLPVLQVRVEAKLDELKRTIALRDKDSEAAREAVSMHLGKNLMDAIRKQVDAMEQDERELLQLREQRSKSSYSYAIASNIFATIFGFAMLGAAVYYLCNNLQTRVKAAAQLYEQREWFRTTVGSIGDGVIATDTEGRVQIINRVAQSLTGWTEDEAIGKPLAEVFPIINEKTREKCENPVANVLRSGEIVGLANHTALVGKDGIERSIADSAAPIHDALGRVTGVVLVFRDVTESKRMEDALARLASFPTLNPAPIMEADYSGRIHYVNPAIRLLFPDLQQREKEHPWLADWEAFVRPLREDGKANIARELSVGDRCYQQTASYVRETERIRVYGTDITLRKRAEELQAQDRANLQSIFDAVNVGMLLIDENGDVRRVNNTISRWFDKEGNGHLGVQPGELVGCVHALTDPAGCGHTAHCTSCRIRNTFESVFRTGESVHDVEAQASLLIEDREVALWLEASADPLVLDCRPHVVLALNNITARKRIEESLKRTSDELARSNQDLEQFAYVASHDLQEPLRMVTGYLQILEDRYKGHLDETADKYIDYAVDGAARMSGLIRDLLAYSRVNSRGEELRSVESDKAFESALRNLGVRIQESAAEITHDRLPTVRADMTQLTQIFQNLVGNALKFHADDRPPRIHVAAREAEGQWLFSVKDNGIGFEQQYEDKIFLIFQRLHGRGQYPGTGIGLAICKRIIERHGGKIWATSTPGEGTTFLFTLPQ